MKQKPDTSFLHSEANVANLDRLFDTVRQQEGRIDILFASAGLEESATVALFLASDHSSYVNGAVSFGDGGASAI